MANSLNECPITEWPLANSVDRDLSRGWAGYALFAKTIAEYLEDREWLLPAGRQTKIFFNEVYTTDRYIYALKFNDKLGNYLSNTGNMKLFIFTWDGELKQVVELDRAALGKLTVDEKQKKAIMINFCSDRSSAPLVEYDLTSLKIFDRE